MNEHDHFREMCAMYAGGLGTEAELREFEEHLATCAECHQRVSDFIAVSAQALAPRTDCYSSDTLRPKRMLDRFIETLRGEGIAVLQPAKPWFWPRFTFRMAVFCGGAAVILFAFFLLAPALRHSISTKLTNVRTNDAPPVDFQSARESSAKTVLPATATPGNMPNQNPETEQLRQALASAQTDNAALEHKNTAMQMEIEAALLRDEQFSSRFKDLDRDNLTLRLEQQKTVARVAELTDQLKKNESGEIDTIATVAERQNRIDELTAKLADRDTELKEEQRLLDANSQARDLIIARNLHIVDVHDNIGAEHRQRAFGRIFYTEGKSLVFYAYDLADPEKLSAKVTFYAWGENLEGEQHPKNLGIFHNEDPSQGRWVLTFDDPKVLARVNTVFVTAETAKKDVDQPKGKRILFAFLGAEPNHP